jgi:malonyl-CoA O-methyltransferase
MMFEPSVIRKTVKRYISTYDAYAVLYREIADRLLEQLNLMRIQPSYILDLGAGSGYITPLLKKIYPYAHIIALDWVEEVLQGRANSLCAHAAQLPFQNNTIDLVISNAMLPWCENNEAIFSEVQRVLSPNALFLFSTFGPDTLGELRASWAKVDDKPHVHLFFDLHDIGDALLRAGFVDPVMQTEWLTLLYSSMRSLRDDLKNTGSTNILVDRRLTLTGQTRFQLFLEEYDTYRDASGKLPATFEITYGHCWKSAKPLARKGEVSIPISQIKRAKK